MRLLIPLLLILLALPAHAKESLPGGETGLQLGRYLEQINPLLKAASGSDKLKYIAIQMNGVALLDKMGKHQLLQSDLDAVTPKLGAILADGQITDAEANAWLDEVKPLTRAPADDPLK